MICFLITKKKKRLTFCQLLCLFIELSMAQYFLAQDYLNTIYFYSLKNIEIWQMFLVLVGAVRTGFKTGCSDFFSFEKVLNF